MKKAQKGVTQTKRFTSKRSSSYPVEEKVEYDTTGYSSGKTMFPAKFTKTYASGKVETSAGKGDKASVDKAIKEPVRYEGTRTQFTKLPAKGSDIRKYMTSRPAAPLKGPLRDSTASKSTPAKSTTKEESPKTSGSAAKKSAASAKKSSAPEKKVSSPKKSTPEAKKPGITPKIGSVTTSKIKKDLELPKREAVDISYKPKARTYSDSEKKIMGVMEKGKKKDGTMKEGAQRRIASIRAKERAVAQRAKNKAGRVAKRAAVKTAKANVKAVRKSFKK